MKKSSQNGSLPLPAFHIQRSSKANSIDLLQVCTGGMRKVDDQSLFHPGSTQARGSSTSVAAHAQRHPEAFQLCLENTCLTDHNQTKGNNTPVEATSSFRVMPRHTIVPSLNLCNCKSRGTPPL